MIHQGPDADIGCQEYGCRTYIYQGRPYYYYQEPDGSMVVRRPTIEVHGSIDIVH
jgi:hypothetical protein